MVKARAVVSPAIPPPKIRMSRPSGDAGAMVSVEAVWWSDKNAGVRKENPDL